MVGDARNLAIEHADVLRTNRDFEPEQGLHGECIGVLLVHRRDIVEPVEIGHGLQVGLVLDQLFGAAMEQANVGVGALDHLAVHLQHQAQHAVRRRMLRPEIQGHVADLALAHGQRPSSPAFSSPGKG